MARANFKARRKKVERLGETRTMNSGLSCKIIEYNNANNITVEFENGVVLYNQKFQHFKNGNISAKNGLKH